jgi:hypothetical protein
MSTTLARIASLRPGLATSVSVRPGRMQLTVTPCGPSSVASARVMPITAALEVT